MKRNTLNYALFGALFGLMFPVIATLFDILVQELPMTWDSIRMVQSNQPLHWIINTAPLFLGIFASFAGSRQDKVQDLNEAQEYIIDERTADLKITNEELKREIDQRKITEFELIAAKEEAIESQQAEERFLANMSHEIRTPLNSIVGFTRLLTDTPLTEQQSDYLKSLKYSSNHLLAIINDILELSKIKAGQIEFESLPIGSSDLFESVLNTVRISAENKNLDINLALSEATPAAFMGDVVRMSQVLLNLLNNAIKFTSAGSVTLSVVSSDKSNHTRFEIRDTGIGIPADKLQSIFDDFKQAESNTTRLYGGTGLGLAISKKLIEMMGGHIGVTSQLGVGSTFWFELELEPCEVPQAETNAFNQVVRMSSDLSLNILLAEDKDMNRLLAKNVFACWGDNFHIDCAINGKEALELFIENDYDVVLMDLQMPVMDGFTACEFIRTELDPPKRDVPIIALTADVLAAERKRAFQVGMNEYVTKPFKPEELFVKIIKCAEAVTK
jgi:signal transduction histidine kinase/ActR/RegA family two-component response regulator